MAMNWIKKIEKVFSAAAFAEAGEHETAMKMAGIQPAVSDRFSRFLNALSSYFSAITFAEADCHDIARQYIGKPAPKMELQQPFENFLETIGLQGVRVRYGVINI